MVTGAARRLTAGEHEIVDAILAAVDRKGRVMDEKWGVGRLPTLVGAEWAERFASQKRKFSEALWRWDVAETRKHGEAMLRAYDKLDALAEASGAQHGPSEQWEFMAGDELVILVRDRSRVGQVDTNGRRAQVWSLDEIASVIRAHPVLAAAKDAFPGAEVVSVRPAYDFKNALDDSLEGLPFAS